MCFVRQLFPDRQLNDIEGEVRRQLTDARLAGRLKPGGRIAIGVGSRGISNLATIVRAAVDYWKAAGAQPFVFPAMGSHGAATAEGQAEVLAHYGIDEGAMGCPIVSSLEVVPTGVTPEGIETCADRNALESDGVMLVARVKWHTDFIGTIESGLLKMLAIGMGKLAGAQRYHTHGQVMGLETVIRSSARQVLKTGKIVGGLAILEDAYQQTAKIAAVPADEMEQREEELLALVKSWMARIPVNEVDVLIVDNLGKDISGTGMDTKVVNRNTRGVYNPWPDTPRIRRIFVRDLSPHSYGNALGLGMADVVTDRLVAKVNWEPTMVNSLTAGSLGAIRTPIHFPTDRECLEKLAPTAGKVNPEQVTFGWIANTLRLDRIALSEHLLPEIKANPALELLGPAREMPFDDSGNLVSCLDD